MTTLAIYYPGALEPFIAGEHRQVTIKSNVGTTVLTITSPETDHSGFAGRWVEVERPGLDTLLRRAGNGLHKYRLRATLNAPAGSDVEADLAVITGGHTAMDDVAVAYGPLEAGRYVITDVTVRSLLRRQGSNAIVRAELELELSERKPEPAQVLPAPVPSVAPPPAPAVASNPAPARTHTIRRGDTLWELAQTYYRDGNQWRRIADANAIRDPRALAVGLVVTIP